MNSVPIMTTVMIKPPMIFSSRFALNFRILESSTNEIGISNNTAAPNKVASLMSIPPTPPVVIKDLSISGDISDRMSQYR